VLLLGETGTGKELVAKSIHEHWSLLKSAAQSSASNTGERPFVTINCALLSYELLRDELMGHAKGAYTGANQNKLGKALIAAGMSPKGAELKALDPALRSEEVQEGLKKLGQRLDAAKKNAITDRDAQALHNEMFSFLQTLSAEVAEAQRGGKRAESGGQLFHRWLQMLGQCREPKDASSPLDLEFDNHETFGTLFLDEIGYLDPVTQGMILRLVGAREVSPLGYEGVITPKHLRIIAATSNKQWANVALADVPSSGAADSKVSRAIADDAPKEDLYHRLAYHVVILEKLRKEEVGVFIARKGTHKTFWDLDSGKKIIEGIKDSIDAGEFRGHRRELSKLIELIESYIRVQPLLGEEHRGEYPSWEFVKTQIWFKQQPVSVFPTQTGAPWTLRDFQERGGLSPKNMPYHIVACLLQNPDKGATYQQIADFLNGSAVRAQLTGKSTKKPIIAVGKIASRITALKDTFTKKCEGCGYRIEVGSPVKLIPS